jgi:hypothetical protein
VVPTPFYAGDPLGTAFLTAGVGTVTLVADISMLGLEQSFQIELTQPN